MTDHIWKKYARATGEMRPYILGEPLEHIAVNEINDPLTDMGMVARNPLDHEDQWYVARKYFEDNFTEVPPTLNTLH